MIGIIDYGMGNLKNVENAFKFLGYNAKIVTTRQEIAKADKIILPGVGAFRDGIDAICKNEFDKEIKEAVSKGKILLGICIGMQLLFEVSYENGEFEGLSVLEGKIVRLNDKLCKKVPHIGWNSLNITKKDPLFTGLNDEPYVYFVHSYHIEAKDEIICATTFYGKEIQVAAHKNNVFALQFHPEKSGNVGLQVLKNFAEL